MGFEVGMKNEWTITVTDDLCADASNDQFPKLVLPHVLSTPSMISLMELTSADLMAKNLDEGFGSVGMAVDIKHVKATPAGGHVRCESVVKEIKGKKLLFEVTCYDDEGMIGTGTHRRAIIPTK